MCITPNAVVELLRTTLGKDQLERAFIYLSANPFTAGDRLILGLEARTAPFDGRLVFVDLEPKRNWAHPCLYVLINSNDLSTNIVEASFPPHSQQFPDSYVIVLKRGAVPRHDKDFSAFDE